MAAAMVRHAHQPVLYEEFVPRAGTCQLNQNRKFYSMLLEEYQLPAWFSSPLLVGMNMKVMMATARMRSRSRCCLLGTDTTVGYTTAARGTWRASGVLQSTIAISHTVWTCSIVEKRLACSVMVLKTLKIQFVA